MRSLLKFTDAEGILRTLDAERFKRFARQFGRVDRLVEWTARASDLTGRPMPPGLLEFARENRPKVAEGLERIRAMREGGDLGVLPLALPVWIFFAAASGLILGSRYFFARKEEAVAASRRAEADLVSSLATIPPENRAAFNATLESLRAARAAVEGPGVSDVVRFLVIGAAVVGALYLVPAAVRAFRGFRTSPEPEEE